MVVYEALNLSSKGQFRAAEEALVRSFDDPDCCVADWPAVVEHIVKATSPASAETLAWATLDAIQVRLSGRDAIPDCGRIFRLFSKNDEFRTRAVELYQQAFENEDLDQLIDIAGLKGGKPIRRALQTLDLCLGLRVGDFVVHKEEGPPAKIVHIEPKTWNVRLEMPAGQELFDPVTLGDQYQAAGENDFRVLQQFDPEGFAKKLNQRPAEIVSSIVQAHENRITSDELELLLSPRHIPSSAWAKWWTKARNALKKHPNIRLQGRNPVFVLYEKKTLAIEDDVWAQFDMHAGPKAWLELGQKYLRECKNRGLAHKPEFLVRLRDAVIAEAAALEQRRDNDSLAAYLTAAELSRMAAENVDDAAVLRLIDQTDNLCDAFLTLPGEAYWTQALDCVQRAKAEDWPEICAELIPIAAPGRCDVLAKHIRQAGKEHLLTEVVRTILGDRITNVNGLCWLYQGPKDHTGLNLPPLTTLLTRLFGVLDQVRHSTTMPSTLARDIRARVRSILTARNCERVKECLEQIDVGMADALCTQVRRAEGLTDNVRNDLLNCIHSKFPTLWVKPQTKPWEDQQVLYCTTDGYAVKDVELDELVNVKMKENAVAIGKAAEHGDLSENSEYRFALEERDLLRARVAEIQSQMALAAVLQPEDAPLGHIGVGSRALLKHIPTGKEIALTFLGPWEADVDSNILNYQAPISQRLMGLKVGESVEFEFKGLEGEFEVLAIESGLS